MILAHEAVAAARIRRAEAADAAALTRLALTSKAVWGYDAAFMQACRTELTVGADRILGDPTFLAEAQGRILGFYQLRLHETVADVWLMFVAPEAMRSGVGRRLWAHLEQTARAAGAARLEVDSDPHAEAFYLAMGMRRAGNAASGSIPGRMLPHLKKEIGPKSLRTVRASRRSQVRLIMRTPRGSADADLQQEAGPHGQAT